MHIRNKQYGKDSTSGLAIGLGSGLANNENTTNSLSMIVIFFVGLAVGSKKVKKYRIRIGLVVHEGGTMRIMS
jgi:hypothetical protein